MNHSLFRRVGTALLLMLPSAAPAAADDPKPVNFPKFDAEVFARFDDGDDVLTAAEIGDYPWARFDADGDGRVTKSEFIIGRLNDRLDYNTERDAEKAWKLLDWTSDDKLTGRELDGAKWLQFDGNGDAVVTKTEFLVARGAAPGPQPSYVPAPLPGPNRIPPADLAAGWKRFEALGFEFQMPEQTKPLEQDGSKQFQYIAPDQHSMYQVMIRDSGDPDTEKNSAEQFDRLRDALVEALKGEVLEEKTIDLAGRPGRDLTLKAPGDVQFRQRAFIVGSRMIRTFVSTDADSAATPAEINRFFASLRLTDVVAADGWKAYQEQGFEFQMPVGAKRDDADGAIQYQFTTPDQLTVYQTMVHDLGTPATEAVAVEKLDYIRDFVVKTISGKVLNETEIELAGSPGRDLTVETDELTIRHRAYVIGSRMIRLFVTAEKKSTATTAEINRFLTSLKIAGGAKPSDDDVPPPPRIAPPRTGITPPPAAPGTDDDVPAPPRTSLPAPPPAPPAPPGI